MKNDLREREETARRLLRAARPEYPADMDERLRAGLRPPTNTGIPVVPRRRPYWLAAVAAGAAAALVGVLLLYRPSGPEVGGGETPAPRLVRQRVVAPVVPRPPDVAPAPRRPARLAAVSRRPRPEGAVHPVSVPPERVRLEFTIPEKNIIILWEQRADFDSIGLTEAVAR